MDIVGYFLMIGSFGELFINLGLVEMGSWGAADAGGDGGGEGSGAT